MTEALLVGVLAAWMAEALALGYVMGRRGYDALAWTGIALFFGPLAVGIAVWFAHQSPSRAPKLLHAGRTRSGAVDVLVGIDGSPESRAAVERVAHLLRGVAGRVTLATVIPVDATPEAERDAETLLAAISAAHRGLDPSTVVLRGEPITALQDYVLGLGYDLLVVGTRGQSRSKALLGSVATGLARRAGIPVLLVDDAGQSSAASRRLREVV